jgi:hypothetical protein
VRYRLSILEERRRIEDGKRRLSEGESLSQIATAWGLSSGSVARKFLKSRGVDTSEGQSVRREEAELDRKHRLKKIQRYQDTDLCANGCPVRAKANGLCRRCYINNYKRERRLAESRDIYKTGARHTEGV